MMSGGLGPEDEPMEETEETGSVSKPGLNFLDSHISNTGIPALPPQRKSIYTNPANAKRPKLDEKWASQSPLRNAKLSPKKNSPVPAIVRNFSARGRKAASEEPGHLILNTEDEISRMYDETREAQYNDEQFQEALGKICDALSTAWYHAPNHGTEVGPGDNAQNYTKAGFLGSLLLQLHHPPAIVKPSGVPNFGFGPRQVIGRSTVVPIPKLLLDWLETNKSLTGEIQALKQLGPDPTASLNFWEIVNAAVLRGRLSEALQILRSADFNYARSALEDGLPQAGYRGAQLQNIQRCINKALQVLEACPSVQHDDWDVCDAEWSLYRKRVLAAMSDLEEFAEGDEQPAPATSNPFQAAHFGLGPTPFQGTSFTETARMAESKVPWTIYQSLRSMYRIILGDSSAIMNHAESWVEAAIALTAWWDGEDDEAPNQSEDPYLRRLSTAFSHVTNAQGEEAGFRINSLSGVEVGLAAVFEGDVEGVLELLQTWSLCVSAAVTEVASVGGWLEPSESRPAGLSEDDLMVLSYGQNDKPTRRVNRDDVLNAYANCLFERRSIEHVSGARDGWELALEVLSRLDDNAKMQKSVSELLEKLPLDTAEQMDRVVLLCSELGLIKEGRRVSEVSFQALWNKLIPSATEISRCPTRKTTAWRSCAMLARTTGARSSLLSTCSYRTACFIPRRIQLLAISMISCGL